MTKYLQDDTFNALIDRLQGAFMIAATNTGTYLDRELLAALADFDAMPESADAHTLLDELDLTVALIDRLRSSFMIAATSTGTDLRDQLVEALADADVMPASCASELLV